MRCSWNIYELRNNIKILEKQLAAMEDEKEIDLITSYICMYKEMLDIIVKKEYKNPFLFKMESLNLEEITEIFFENISDKDCRLLDLLIDSWSIIESVNDEILETPTIACSNKGLIEKTDVFLKEYLPSNTYQAYIRFKSENPNYLQIQKGFVNQEYGGLTYIDCILRKKYIALFRENTYMDFITLPHELFHLLFNDFNSFLSQCNQNYYTREIEGSFANLLAIDFYEREFPEISRSAEQSFLFSYKEMIYSLIIGACYLNSTNHSGNLRLNKFYKLLGQYIPNSNLTMEDIKIALSSSCEQIINYGLSYLASIDLFEIYQKDSELAFYLLKNIRFIKQEDNALQTLRRNHITFMDDGFENFKKYVKKIERKK